ncbi:MAG TPA: hypothetical protein VGR47_08965 [Terracidiphilus sp.]|nr:hypothetical protein [Terracidiphilus sp.]
MSNVRSQLGSQVRWLVLILFTINYGVVPVLGQQEDTQGQPGVASRRLPEAPKPVPGPALANPGTSSSSSEIALADSSQTQNASQTGGQEAAGTNQQQGTQKPVGTAAAPPESAPGVTASRPAGAVIAPAKQRRARAILIRVGLLVGAGVALGTVLALTHATPSQPQ